MIAAAVKPAHVHNNDMKNGRQARSIALIVTSLASLLTSPLFAAEPPEGFLKKIAERETQNAMARDDYTYRQSVAVQEFNIQGLITGEYTEIRDITFTPSKSRFEQIVQPG
jgi:hypothetical protein